MTLLFDYFSKKRKKKKREKREFVKTGVIGSSADFSWFYRFPVGFCRLFLEVE